MEANPYWRRDFALASLPSANFFPAAVGNACAQAEAEVGNQDESAEAKPSETLPYEGTRQKHKHRHGRGSLHPHGAQDSETIVFYRSVLSQGPSLLLFFSLVLLAGYLSLLLARGELKFPLANGDMRGSLFPHLAIWIFPAVLGAKIIHSLFDARYIIAEDYVRSFHGLLSLRKHDVRLQYQHLRGVDVERGLYGRAVNIGNLRLWTLMPTEVELVIDGVRNPSKYRDLIFSRRERSRAH